MPVVRSSELRVGDGDQALVPLKESALPNLPLVDPGGVRERAGVAVAGLVGGRRAAALVEAVGGDEAGRRPLASRVALASLEAGLRLPARVLGGHLVVVGAGGEAGVGVARAGRLRDPVRRRRREARASSSGGRCTRMTPTLSVAAVQRQRRLAGAAGCAQSPVGALGAVVSATSRWPVFETGPTLPAASSAVTL